MESDRDNFSVTWGSIEDITTSESEEAEVRVSSYFISSY
jgi:hypothetical protein